MTRVLFAGWLAMLGTACHGTIYFQDNGARENWPNYPQRPQANGTIENVTNPVYQGTSAIKFAQTFLTNGYAARYHSEVVIQGSQRTNESRYYRTTVYIAPDWVYAGDDICIQQWAGDGPWIIMEIRQGNLVILPHVGPIRTLQPMPRGQWVRIVTHLVSANPGLLEIWVDGVQRTAITGDYTPRSRRGEVRWSVGEYVTRWFPKRETPPGPYYRELFHDNFRITSTFEEADQPHWDESYLVNATPASQTAGRESANASYTVNVTTNGGFSGTVAFALEGLPPNANYRFDPTSLASAGTAALTVTASRTTPAGSYPLTVCGIHGTATNTVNVSLELEPPASSAAALLGGTNGAVADLGRGKP